MDSGIPHLGVFISAAICVNSFMDSDIAHFRVFDADFTSSLQLTTSLDFTSSFDFRCLLDFTSLFDSTLSFALVFFSSARLTSQSHLT